MQYITQYFAHLGTGFAVLLALAGCVYGLFGWRIVRLLILLDTIVLAGLLAFASHDSAFRDALPIPPIVLSISVLLVLPICAWLFEKRAALGFFGVIGFLATLIVVVDLTPVLEIRIGSAICGAGLCMALGLTMYRQTTVLVTGLHGGCLITAALAILAAHPTNGVGAAISSLTTSYDFALPAGVLAFSVILIAVQWADLQGNESAHAFAD